MSSATISEVKDDNEGKVLINRWNECKNQGIHINFTMIEATAEYQSRHLRLFSCSSAAYRCLLSRVLNHDEHPMNQG
jgi:hypothetical protein